MPKSAPACAPIQAAHTHQPKERDMRSTAWKYIIGLTLLTVTAIPLRLAAQQSQQQRHYVVKDLGTLGGSQGVAEGIEGISDRGWVVGSANLPGDQSGQALLCR